MLSQLEILRRRGVNAIGVFGFIQSLAVAFVFACVTPAFGGGSPSRGNSCWGESSPRSRQILFESSERTLLSAKWNTTSIDLAEAMLHSKDNYFSVSVLSRYLRWIKDGNDQVYSIVIRYRQLVKSDIRKRSGMIEVHSEFADVRTKTMTSAEASSYLLNNLARKPKVVIVEIETSFRKCKIDSETKPR